MTLNDLNVPLANYLHNTGWAKLNGAMQFQPRIIGIYTDDDDDEEEIYDRNL